MHNRILDELSKSKKPLRRGELSKRVRVPKRRRREFSRTLNNLTDQGKIVEKNGRYNLPRRQNLMSAEIVKVTDRFGFARPETGEKDLFIPGRDLKGSMPGDKVMLRVSPTTSGELDEAEVMEITEIQPRSFSGNLVENAWGELSVLPDDYVKFPIQVDKNIYVDGELGDKVLATISKRGKRHRDHRADVLQVFGSSEHAYICAKAILAEKEIEPEFSQETLDQAKAIASGVGIHPKELAARKDLRDELIFTIDGADTKDIDDAISLKPNDRGGWELGVHIADVSYYVTRNSPLDRDAFARGTSVYYADQVIPMLPPELSNGICSLNPGEDRLAFSAIMEIREDGTILDYRFEKTVIRSRMQGVYSEINPLLTEEDPDKALLEKYSEVLETLKNMRDLAEILQKRRSERHAINLSSTESKIIVENNRPVDIKARKQQITEHIIEEFMLCANECAASFAQKMSLPFIYRVHDDPDSERVDGLYQLLDRLGVEYSRPKAGQAVAPSLAAVLDKVSGTEYEMIVNYAMLRTMAKAKYSEENSGHFGLALKNYAHFTSPIRRYPDLAIHRILTGLLTGMRRDNIEKHFRDWVKICAAQSSKRELDSMEAERSIEDCYKAEYMQQFIGAEMEGTVSSVTGFGIFIQLDNTVEGLIGLGDFPNGNWNFDNLITYTNELTGAKIRLGDKIEIQVARSNVPAGEIDFVFAKPELYGAPKDDAKQSSDKKVVPRTKRRKK